MNEKLCTNCKRKKRCCTYDEIENFILFDSNIEKNHADIIIKISKNFSKICNKYIK